MNIDELIRAARPYLDSDAVADFLGISVRHFRERVASRTEFPAAIRITPLKHVWRVVDVEPFRGVNLTPSALDVRELDSVERCIVPYSRESVYVIDEGDDASPVKIGFVKGGDQAIAARIRSLMCGNHRPLRLLRRFRGSRQIELMTHGIFGPERLSGEWFQRSARIGTLIACRGERLSSCVAAALGYRLEKWPSP